MELRIHAGRRIAICREQAWQAVLCVLSLVGTIGSKAKTSM